MVPDTESIVQDVQNLRQNVENLQRRLESIEKLFNQNHIERGVTLDADAADRLEHKDARDVVQPGDIFRVVISETPEQRDKPDAVGYLYGIVTFIDPNGHDLENYDVVEVAVDTVKQNAIEAGCRQLVSE